jgi:hypothetical protein
MNKPLQALGKAIALFPVLARTLDKIEAAKADGKASVPEWVDIVIAALAEVGRVLLPLLPPPVQRVVGKVLLLLPILGQAMVEWDQADDAASAGGTKRTAAEYALILQRAGERALVILLPDAQPVRA